MKVSFTTLGCKVNQYETQALKNVFSRQGYEVVSEEDSADICIVNTCSVTNLSDRKSRQAIRRFKKRNPEAIIAVVGCYAQTGAEKLESMTEVDIIAGTNEKQRLISLVEEFIEKRKSSMNVIAWDELKHFEELGTIEVMEGRTRAYIKIQEGCDRFCSYCIIPYARGHMRSRKKEDILKEVHHLLEKGYRELVLTGVNTALYGAEHDGKPKLHELIETINHIPGEFRIRLSSLEPTVVNAAYITQLMKAEKLCPHIHLSVQSGSDRILKLMNRRYDLAEYLNIVTAMKKHDPLFGITTDMIVGFPTETTEDFEQSLALAKMVDFSKIHVFRYSRRDGTVAADMAGQVAAAELDQRSTQLIAAGETSGMAFLHSNQNAVRAVLFEEIVLEHKFVTGLTDNYIRIYVEINEKEGQNLINSIRQARIGEPFLDGARGYLL